jgi:formate-dependent nitrite reductase membrane component NrfD
MNIQIIDTSQLKYSLPKDLVWGIHIIVGLFFIAISAVYLSYKDKDEKDIPINLKTMNEGVYIVILILGAFMAMYHGHLLVIEKKWLSGVFGS